MTCTSFSTPHGNFQNKRTIIGGRYGLRTQSLSFITQVLKQDVFRKADKRHLAQAICDNTQYSISDSGSKTEYHVFDGGSLIHRIPWKRGNSYGEIAQSYVDFTIRHYGSTVLRAIWLWTMELMGMDYGEGPTIKDNTHQRRGENIHPIISFTAETKFAGKRSSSFREI